MKKFGWVLIGIIAVLVIYYFTTRNRLVDADQGVKTSWSFIQAQLQSRLDKFKNIIASIQSSAKFEDTVLTKVVKARYEDANAIKLDPNNPATIDALTKAQANLQNSIKVVFENYPQLQTTQAFRDFNAVIEGEENRLKTARRDYSTSINTFNNLVLKFPSSMVASMAGYKEKPYYEAENAAQTAPDVNELMKRK